MKESEKNRAILSEVVARAWREPPYLAKLRMNPKQVFEDAGVVIPKNMEIVLLENTQTLINAILPPKGDMSKYEARIQKAVHMLKDLPEDVAVHLHRDSAIRSFVVIPEAPTHGTELTDAQLEQVVGGKGSAKFQGSVATTTTVATATNVVTNANVVQTIEGMTTELGAVEVLGVAVAVVAPCFIS